MVIFDLNYMIKEFCNLTNIHEDNITSKWLDVENQVLTYSTSESIKPIKSLLGRFSNNKENTGN